MNDKINEIPSIPEPIKEAARSGLLTVFVGAGVSQIVGCKSWKDLAKDCLKYAKNVCSYSYAEFDSLLKYESRKLFTICIDELKRKDLYKNYDIEKALKFDKKKNEEYSIYENLYSWNVGYVTTNYDFGFIDVVQEKVRDVYIKQKMNNSEVKITEAELKKESDKYLFDEIETILQSNLDKGKVLFLHGSLRDPDNLIITLDDYIKRYRGNSSTRKFLNYLFEKQTVLFMGYGLNEQEILEYIVGEKQKTQHFVLFPLMSKDECLKKFEEAYYKKIGLKPVFYNIDYQGYEQLSEVVKAWGIELRDIARERQHYEKESTIKRAILDTNVKDENVYNLISSGLIPRGLPRCDKVRYEQIYPQKS